MSMRGASAKSVKRKSTSMRLSAIAWLVASLLVGDALAMIYLEDVGGALFYDRSHDAAMPKHYLTHSSPSEWTSMSTPPSSVSSLLPAEDASVAPSIAPSLAPTASGGLPNETNGNSSIFSRGLAGNNAAAQGSFNFNYSIDNDDLPFNDLLLINSSLDYVYYDSKQDMFGADLGPRGCFQVVNLMLPPRGLWGGQLLQNDNQPDFGQGDNSQQSHLNDSSSAPQSATNHSLRGHRTSLQYSKSIESIDQFLGLTEPTSDNHNGTVTTLGNQTLVEDQWQPMYVNGSLDDQEQQSLTDNSTSTSDKQQHLNSTSGASQDGSTTYEPFAENNIDNITNSRDHAVYVSDYFCLEDFKEWRTQRRRQQHSLLKVRSEKVGSRNDSHDDVISSYESPSPIAIPPGIMNDSFVHENVTNSSSSINSTRPIAILVRRGRCSSESKAQMAMLLNEMFIADGKTNQISHLIVYNNETILYNNGTHDNDDQDDEDLIEMELISQTTGKGNGEGWLSQDGLGETRYKVGLLYVTSRSGHDLIQRMKEQQRTTGVYPYLDVSGLFMEELSGNRRRPQVNGTMTLEKSTQDNGEYTDSIHIDMQTTHDPLLTNGWFYPATLTRFCFSCGPARNYGFDLVPDSGDTNTNGHDEGWINGGRPPQTHGSNNDDIVQDYSGSYNTQYIPEEWVQAVRKLMISVLAVLLIGPFIFAVWRWHTVGGTVRITTDENGSRRLRLIAPNLEVFVNGAPGAVEGNGTKLDRAQVFALPEMEFVRLVGDESVAEASAILREIAGGGSILPERESEHTPVLVNAAIRDSQEPISVAQSPPTPPPSFGDYLETGVFVSSTCCSICIDEFVHGERVRILPRCNHAFHTGECGALTRMLSHGVSGHD
ncbi:hypothetical protein HJC23_001426 [Cyclotella cryptica]|uniref:RING-type domain-containing protein n=1 Tax=Cyclotella cryptica TaxID=29204 RepID=A0ABD3NPI8_9STRA